MTLLDFHGYDDGVAEPGLTVVASGSTGRSGVGSCVQRPSGGASSPLGIFTGAATTIFGVGVQHGNAAAVGTFLYIIDSGLGNHLRISRRADKGLDLLGPTGAVVASSTAGFATPDVAWYYLECKSTIADAGGTVEIRCDEVVVLTYTGDTRNAGTGTVTRIGCGGCANGSTFFDDFYACDNAGAAPYNDYLGDVVIRSLLPSGNGASSQFVGSDGNSVDNYLLVDEPTSSAADYVGTAATGMTDLYALPDIPTTDLPLATQVLMFAGKSDAGTPPVLKPVTRGDGGTVLEESAIALSTTYQQFLGAIRLTDPDGDALTAANVNGMQVGARTS